MVDRDVDLDGRDLDATDLDAELDGLIVVRHGEVPVLPDLVLSQRLVDDDREAHVDGGEGGADLDDVPLAEHQAEHQDTVTLVVPVHELVSRRNAGEHQGCPEGVVDGVDHLGEVAEAVYRPGVDVELVALLHQLLDHFVNQEEHEALLDELVDNPEGVVGGPEAAKDHDLARDRPVHVLDAPLADVHVGNEPGPGLGQLLGLAGGHSHGLDDLRRIDDRLAPEHRVLQAVLRVHLVPLLVQEQHHVAQFFDCNTAQRPDCRYEIGGFRVLHFMIGAVVLDRRVEQDFSVAECYDRPFIGLPEKFLRFFAWFDGTCIDVFKFLSVNAPCCGHAFSPFPLALN